MIKYLTKDDDFQKIVKDKTLVDFYADWCGPCQMMGKVLEDYNGDVNILKVNTDEYSDLAMSFGVMSIPSLIFIENGSELKNNVGLLSKDELDEFLK